MLEYLCSIFEFLASPSRDYNSELNKYTVKKLSEADKGIG